MDRWQQAEHHFARLIRADPDERCSLLRRLKSREPELAGLVIGLLEADGAAGSFLETAVGTEMQSYFDGAQQQTSIKPGDMVGPYRIVREIGRGGMSLVYLVERTEGSFAKPFALKIIRRGMDTDEIRSRFRTEQKILSNLDHPHIARMFDAGATPEGLPYFVMEYVDGEPVDRYCDQQRLSIAERIQLFRQVCDAVSYAHQNLIIHRDLKPSNVLVTADGTPKLLDFGVAKMLVSHPVEGTTHLQWGRPLTPEFASPEQLRGDSVTTASDIYSLGVLLYVLLTDQKPYLDGENLAATLVNRLAESEPSRPSLVVLPMENLISSTDLENARAIEVSARARGCSPQQLSRRLRGDLDNILLLALRVEANQRYASVQDFSADLERHLFGLPVAAREPTLSYRCQKFIRRHWLGTCIATAFVLILVSFSASLLFASARTARERDRAAQVSSLLAGLFEIADPAEGRGQSITGRELLDRGSENVMNNLQAHPETQAMLLETLGNLYLNLGIYDRAEQVIRKSIDLYQRDRLVDDPELADRLNALGRILAQNGRFREAERVFEDCLSMRMRLFGFESQPVSLSLNNLALINHDLGHWDKALGLYEQVVVLDDKIYGAGSAHSLVGKFNYALFLYDSGRYHKARELLKRAFEPGGGLKDAPDHRRAWGCELMAQVCQAEGDLGEAENWARQSLQLRRRSFGDHHRETARAYHFLGSVLRDQEHFNEAGELLYQSLAMRIELLGPHHAELAASYEELGNLALDCGQPFEAESYYHEAWQLYSLEFDDQHPLTGRIMIGLARAAMAQSQHEEATLRATKALNLLPLGEFHGAYGEVILANHLRGHGKIGEARRVYQNAYRAIATRLGKRHPQARALALRAEPLSKAVEKGTMTSSLATRQAMHSQ